MIQDMLCKELKCVFRVLGIVEVECNMRRTERLICHVTHDTCT